MPSKADRNNDIMIYDLFSKSSTEFIFSKLMHIVNNQCVFVNENENGEKRENNEFVNEN